MPYALQGVDAVVFCTFRKLGFKPITGPVLEHVEGVTPFQKGDTLIGDKGPMIDIIMTPYRLMDHDVSFGIFLASTVPYSNFKYYRISRPFGRTLGWRMLSG